MKNEDYKVATDEVIENLKYTDEIKEIAKALRYENLEEVTVKQLLDEFCNKVDFKEMYGSGLYARLTFAYPTIITIEILSRALNYTREEMTEDYHDYLVMNFGGK